MASTITPQDLPDNLYILPISRYYSPKWQMNFWDAIYYLAAHRDLPIRITTRAMITLMNGATPTPSRYSPLSQERSFYSSAGEHEQETKRDDVGQRRVPKKHEEYTNNRQRRDQGPLHGAVLRLPHLDSKHESDWNQDVDDSLRT